MTPEQLDQIEARANAAKSVTGDDAIESGLAWAQDWESMTYDVTRRDGNALFDHARCVAEETADLVIHGPDDIAALVAEVRRLRTAIDEVRELHRPFRVFDECDHAHEYTDPDHGLPDGVVEIAEIGLTCEDGYVYTICQHCCTGGWDFQTEECVDGHKHGPDVPYCQTVRTLDDALDPKEKRT